MVGGPAAHLTRFSKGEAGISMTEGLLVFPIVLLTFAALVEFGYAVHQWNQVVKATQIGARLAAVSDPLADLSPIVVHYRENATVGQPPSTGAPTIVCGAGTVACDSTQLNRLVYGSDGICDPNYGSSLPGVCDFHSWIRPSNLRIAYSPSGLGYVGRPGGPIVTVTLEIINLNFRLPLLGALLGVDRIEIPPHPASITSEDLSNTVP